MADIVAISDFSELEKRTSKSGKDRFTIAITGEPVVIDLDPAHWGAELADAVAGHMKAAVQTTNVQASPATLKYREKARKAYLAGKPWAMKRYSGGRTGAMEPDRTNLAFNDSGRFAETIVVGGSRDGKFRVNVAANRLDPTTGNIQRIWDQLIRVLPELANPGLFLSSDIVKQTLKKTRERAFFKLRPNQPSRPAVAAVERSPRMRDASAFDVTRAAFRLAKQVAGLGGR